MNRAQAISQQSGLSSQDYLHRLDWPGRDRPSPEHRSEVWLEVSATQLALPPWW